MIVVSSDVTTNMSNTTNRPASEPTGTICTGILLYYNMYATTYMCMPYSGKFW